MTIAQKISGIFFVASMPFRKNESKRLWQPFKKRWFYSSYVSNIMMNFDKELFVFWYCS